MCYIALKLNKLETLSDKCENKGSNPIEITLYMNDLRSFGFVGRFLFTYHFINGRNTGWEARCLAQKGTFFVSGAATTRYFGRN
jgi:hypothetical protein